MRINFVGTVVRRVFPRMKKAVAEQRAFSGPSHTRRPLDFYRSIAKTHSPEDSWAYNSGWDYITHAAKLEKSGDIINAELSLLTALKNFESIGSKLNVNITHAKLANLYRSSGDIEKAKIHKKEAISDTNIKIREFIQDTYLTGESDV